MIMITTRKTGENIRDNPLWQVRVNGKPVQLFICYNSLDKDWDLLDADHDVIDYAGTKSQIVDIILHILEPVFRGLSFLPGG